MDTKKWFGLAMTPALTLGVEQYIANCSTHDDCALKNETAETEPVKPLSEEIPRLILNVGMTINSSSSVTTKTFGLGPFNANLNNGNFGAS